MKQSNRTNIDMPTTIHDARNGLNYTLHGDYYLPDIIVDPVIPLGKYGRARLQYLKEHRSNDFTRLLLSGKLYVDLNETDAEFFINLTQNNEVSIDAITTQAQNLINNGADIKQVSQNFKVSQTLLNALNESRQNNQPIRIDFDQNISVILRVGKDGAISANFIPGDKAVEQYLRNNIDSLKNAFDEQDLDYAELTYSNSSKEQNQRRREENKEK